MEISSIGSLESSSARIQHLLKKKEAAEKELKFHKDFSDRMNCVGTPEFDCSSRLKWDSSQSKQTLSAQIAEYENEIERIKNALKTQP